MKNTTLLENPTFLETTAFTIAPGEKEIEGDPFLILGKSIQTRITQKEKLENEIRSFNHSLGNLIFEKKKKLAEIHKNRKDINREIKKFLAEKFPKEQYSETLSKNGLKFAEFAQKLNQLSKSLQIELLEVTKNWDCAAIAALLEIKAEKIGEALDYFKNKTPKGSQIRLWKHQKLATSIELNKTFDDRDAEIVAEKFGLQSDRVQQILSVAKDLRLSELGEGVDLNSAETKPLTNDVIKVLEQEGFKVGKFARKPRAKKIYTELDLQQKLASMEMTVTQKVTNNIVNQIKKQVPQLADLKIEPLLPTP